MLVSDVLVGGRYRLVRRIGAGGMAEVWCAEDVRGGRPVALKLLTEGSGDIRRFAAEVRALSRVSHPAVVRFLGAGDHGGRPYLVMDLVEGETLAERLAAGPLLPDEAARVGASLAGALAAAHRVGVVHRDVKPGNVLLDAGRRVHLADFGVSRLAGAASITGVGAVVGTAGYLAPEQVAGGPVGPAADVYALGLVLLECLTGRRAFPGGAIEAATARLARDPEVPAGLPSPWPSLLAAMTARDPAARPAAEAVAGALGDPGATALLSVQPDATVAVAGDATRVLPAAAPPARRARPVAPAPPRRSAASPIPLVLVGLVLLAAGLLVLLLVVEAAGGGGEDPFLVPATATTGAPAETTTSAPPTTAPPATAPPTTAPPVTTPPATAPPATAPPVTDPGPPPPQDDGRGNGDEGNRGGNGNGNGGGGGGSGRSGGG